MQETTPWLLPSLHQILGFGVFLVCVLFVWFGFWGGGDGQCPSEVTCTVRVGKCHQLTDLDMNLCQHPLCSSITWKQTKNQTNGTIVFWTSVFWLDIDDMSSASSDALCVLLAWSLWTRQPHSLSAVAKSMQSQCTCSALHSLKEGKLFLLFTWVSWNFDQCFRFCWI